MRRTFGWLIALLTSAVVGAHGAVGQGAPVRRTVLASGLKLLSKQNDASDIVAIVCQVRAGLPDEPDDQQGVASLTAESLLGGTTNHPTAQGFAQAVIGVGGDLRAEAGADFTEVTVVTDRSRWQAALKLVADVVGRPAFEEAQVEHARDALRQRITATADDFATGPYQALVAELYNKSGYGRPLLGTDTGLGHLTPKLVRAFWRACYVQNRMTVAIVGDIDSTAAIQVAEKAFAEVPSGASAAPRSPRPEILDRPRVELVQKPGPGGQVMVGFLAPPVTPENYPVYTVLEALLGGGKRSRLSTAFRDKNRMGYALGSTYQPLLGQSHLMAYLLFPVAPPEAGSPMFDQSKQQMLEQFRALTEAAPTDAELARARAFAIGQHALKHERNRDQAKLLSWSEAAGLGVEMDQEYAARASAVTKEQIQAAAKEVFRNYALVICLPPPS